MAEPILPFVICPYDGVTVDGVNPGDLLNNFRIHLQDECAALDPDEAASL